MVILGQSCEHRAGEKQLMHVQHELCDPRISVLPPFSLMIAFLKLFKKLKSLTSIMYIEIIDPLTITTIIITIKNLLNISQFMHRKKYF